MLESNTLKRFNDAKNAKLIEAEQKKKAEAQTENEKDGVGSWFGKQVMSGVGSFNKGVMATLDFILPTEFLGRYDYISKMNDYYSNLGEKYAQQAQKSSETRGKGWKTTGDIVSASVAALPNAVLAFMSGGTSLGGSAASAIGSATTKSSVFSSLGNAVKTMAKNPTYWTSALQTLGTDYEEAKEKGANDFVAATSAILTTALNAGIEVGGGIEKLPKNLKKGGKSAILDWAKSSFEEGGEEVLQGITSKAMAKLMYDHDAPVFSLTDENAVINPIESAKEFGMGVAVGGLLGAGQTTFAKSVEVSNIVKAGKFFNKKGLADSVIYTGLESPKDSEAYKLAEKAMRKLTEENKALTNYEVGKLYYASIKRLGMDAEDIKNVPDETSDIKGVINDADKISDNNSSNVPRNKIKITTDTLNKYIADAFAEAAHQDGASDDVKAYTSSAVQRMAENGVADLSTLRVFAEAYVNALHEKGSGGYLSIVSQTDNLPMALMEYTFGTGDAYVTDALKNNPAFLEASRGFKKSFIKSMEAGVRYSQNHQTAGASSMSAQVEAIKQGDYSSLQQRNDKPSGNVSGNSIDGYIVNGMVNETELDMLAQEAADGAYIRLEGSDSLDNMVLAYESGISPEKVRSDITAYYRDGIMPEVEYPNDLPFEDDVSFSIAQFPGTNKKYVQADEQVIKSENPEEWEKEIFEYVNKTVRKGKDFIIPMDNEENIVITERTAWKLSDRGKFDDDYYMVKGNAAGVIDEIISVSKYLRSKPPLKEHSDGFAKYGFDYRKAYFMDLDGKYYELQLSVGINAEGKEAYNIGKIKEVAIPSKRLKGPYKKGITTYALTIPQKNDIVNSSISENSKNDTNRGEINEGPGELLLSEDNRRRNNESAGKQTYGIRQNGEGKSQSERLEFTRGLRERGLTSERTFNNKYVVDVISEDGYNAEMTELADQLKAYGFENVYFITGKGRFKFLPWQTFEGAVANKGRDIYIQYDAETTPAMLANHEIAHIYYNNDVKKSVLAGLSVKELSEILKRDRYREYNRIYRSYDKVLEEVVCDILSGMSEHSPRFDTAINEFWSGIDTGTSVYSASTYAESIDGGGMTVKAVRTQIENWDKNGRNPRTVFEFGFPSTALRKAGINNQNKIQMDASKVLKIMRTHKDITIDTIIGVKGLLDNPILILKSRTQPDSVVIYGDLETESGIPVMASLRINLKSNTASVETVNKITSVYARDNTQSLISKSEILWIEPNKNRTNRWLNAYRLQLPSAITNPIGSDNLNISQNDTSVNSSISENSKDDTRFTLSDNPDTSYLAEPVRELKDDIKEVMLRADAREGKVYTRADVRQVTNSILENIDPGTGRGLSMSKKLQSKMQNLVGWVLNTPAERREKYLKRLASYIAQNAVVYDASDTYDYEGDLDFLKGYVFHSIKLSENDKETLDAIGASGYKALFSSPDRGTGVDVVYDNMSQARPDLFPADSQSKLERIVEIYDFLKEGVKAESTLLIDVINQEDRQKFVANIENEMNRAFADSELGKNSKVTNALNRAEAEHLAEENRLRNMYETEKQELKNKYEKKIDALKKAAKEQGEKDVEEKGLKPKIKKYKAKATFGENDTGWGKPTVNRMSAEEKRDIVREFTVSGIIRHISDVFDIPISFGNMTDAEGQGEYNEKAITLRTRTANALPVVCYELGIHLDKKYGLSEKIEDKGELTKFLDLQLLKSNKEQSRVSIAIAGFVKTYLTDKENAKALAPKFYDIFCSVLKENGVLSDLDSVASVVNIYMNTDFGGRVDNAIVSSDDSKGIVNKSKQVIKDRKYWIAKFGKTFIDDFLPQKTAMDYVKKRTGNSFSGSNNAYIMATNSREADSRADALILNGMTDLNGNLTGEKSLLECLEPVRDLKLFDRYLLLKHAPSWLETQFGNAKQVFADESLNDVASINVEVAALEEAHPEFKKAAADIYEYQRNLMKYFIVDAGGMKQETFDLFMEMYPNYIPIFRVEDNKIKDGKRVKSLANQVLPIKMAKGGSGEVKSPIESIMYNTKRFVQFATRNQVAQMWGDYADTIDGMGKLIERVRVGDWPLPGDIEKNLEQEGGDVRNVQDMENAIDKTFGKVATGYNPAVNKEKRIVSVLRNGEVAYYQVHDELLYESLADMAPNELTWAIKLSRTIMAPMKILTTSMNPIFSTTNAFRDIFTAYNNSDISNPVKFIEGYIKAVNMMLKQTPEWKQYKALGGGTMSDLSASRDLMKKTLRDIYLKDKGKAARLLSALKHPVHTVASINDFVESVPRFAEYLDVVTRTGDKALAFYKANDLTTNFRRTGTSGQALNAIFMYNNAAIQGLDRVVRSFTDASKPERVKRALKYLIQALLFGVLVRWWNSGNDKEGYENLSAYTKNNFYCFSIGDGKFITLPKAREMAILTTTVERTLDKLSGEDDAFYDFGGYLALQLIPPCLPDDLSEGLVGAGVNMARNTVFGSLVDIAVNEDFKGSPVVSSAYENLPKQMQYNEKTTYTAYFLGQILNQSPMEIDHIMSSTTGILGQMNKALLPMGGEAQRDWSIGVKNKYVRDSNYSTDVLNQVYEMRDSTENEVKLNSTAENALKYEKYKVAASYISEANKLVKSLPADEQREARGKLLDVMNNWDYEMSAIDKYIIDSLGDAYVDDSFGQNSLPKSDISWTENKKKVVCQLSASQYEAYIKDVMKAINAGRAELIKTRDYKSADADERIELIKEMDSDMKSAIKKKYQQKYGGKK